MGEDGKVSYLQPYGIGEEIIKKVNMDYLKGPLEIKICTTPRNWSDRIYKNYFYCRKTMNSFGAIQYAAINTSIEEMKLGIKPLGFEEVFDFSVNKGIGNLEDEWQIPDFGWSYMGGLVFYSRQEPNKSISRELLEGIDSKVGGSCIVSRIGLRKDSDNKYGFRFIWIDDTEVLPLPDCLKTVCSYSSSTQYNYDFVYYEKKSSEIKISPFDLSKNIVSDKIEKKYIDVRLPPKNRRRGFRPVKIGITGNYSIRMNSHPILSVENNKRSEYMEDCYKGWNVSGMANDFLCGAPRSLYFYNS